MSASEGRLTSKVEETMARVRAAVPASARSPVPDPLDRPRSRESRLFPEDVYRSLHQARTIGGGLSVDYTLGWRTPIIGHAWLAVRRRIHQEIRIYLDALTAQQNNLNAHLVRALTHVVEALDGLGLPALTSRQEEQYQAIASLQAELQALRVQVQGLQARLDAGVPSGETNGRPPASG